MGNGTTEYTTTQGVTIVPLINELKKYYLFSLESAINYRSRVPQIKLYYSVIDMELNNGLGYVVGGKKMSITCTNDPLFGGAEEIKFIVGQNWGTSLCDFEAATGKVSNSILIDKAPGYYTAFSPDNLELYVSSTTIDYMGTNDIDNMILAMFFLILQPIAASKKTLLKNIAKK